MQGNPSVTTCGPNGCTTRQVSDLELAFRAASWREQIDMFLSATMENEILSQSVENLQRALRVCEADNSYLREQVIQLRRAAL